MKNLLFLTIAFFSIQIVSAQDITKVANDSIYNTAGIELKPDFPGGMGEFYKYFAKNYQTPNVKRLNGKVYVTFVIENQTSNWYLFFNYAVVIYFASSESLANTATVVSCASRKYRGAQPI